MSAATPIPPITGTVTLAVPIERAFEVLVFTWQFDPDPDHASEIEARFSATGPDQTVVDVEHRHFERLDDGQAIRDAINGGGGWALLLDATWSRTCSATRNSASAGLSAGSSEVACSRTG